MLEVDQVQTESGQGIVGDLSFGRSKRQVLLVDQAILDHFELHPGDLRENVTVAGLTLSELSSGTNLRIGESTLEITGDCSPCDMLNSLKEGLREEIKGQRGLLAQIMDGGPMTVGDHVSVIKQ
jgi:MOSC domain-containing protein YiiM